VKQRAASNDGKPRVLLYAGPYGRLGEVWIHRHATGLKRYECHVAAAGYRNRDLFVNPAVHLVDSENPFLHRLRQAGHFLRWMEWPTAERLEVAGIRRVVRRIAPVLIHAHFLWNLRSSAPVAAEQSVPLVVTGHGTDVNKAIVDEPYRNDVLRGMERVARVIAVSDFIKGKLVQIGCPPGKIRRIYIGAPIPDVCADVASQGDRIQVLCVAAFNRAKGHSYLLEAFAVASQREACLFLTLVGDGPLRRDIERRIVELGITERVTLAGLVPPERLRGLMAASHIYVQPSVRIVQDRPGGRRSVQEEGLAISLVEAASFGLPLVVSRCGGMGEICRDGETGYEVQQRDVAAMADRIVELAQCPDRRMSMGAKARRLAEQEFDGDTQLGKIECLYDDVLESE